MQFLVIFLFFMHLYGYQKRSDPPSAYFMHPIFLENAELTAANDDLMPLESTFTAFADKSQEMAFFP